MDWRYEGSLYQHIYVFSLLEPSVVHHFYRHGANHWSKWLSTSWAKCKAHKFGDHFKWVFSLRGFDMNFKVLSVPQKPSTHQQENTGAQ